MTLVARTYWSGAPFQFREPPADAISDSLVLKAEDGRELRAVYWTPRTSPRPRVAVVCMHPRVDFTHHYAFPRLVAAGIGCLGAMTRYGNDDTDAEHEAMLKDLAACMRWVRERRGAGRVVLLGNSGGGPLSAFYQAQATTPPRERIARTPAGAKTGLDQITMPPADGLILVAAHRGQGRVLARSIDPSVQDENDPRAIDASLDMYDPRNGFEEPPAFSEYADDFVGKFRMAQEARVRRLDDTAHALIEESLAAGREAKSPGFEARSFAERNSVLRRKATERVMVVYRTMANLDYVDRRLDPSPRAYGSLLSDRPDLMNGSYLGLARTCTPRAWLSTWSGLSSNADTVTSLEKISVPTLVVHAGCDRELHPKADLEPISSAVRAADRTIVTLANAGHYFEPPFGVAESKDQTELMDLLVPWIEQRFGPLVEAAPEAQVRPVHPTTKTWTMPPLDRPELEGGILRTNLRELAARPARLEHHLVVVGTIGGVQLELATASEPLYFAHRNCSDEYAIALPTGDPMLDGFPLRTFVSDIETGDDVGRLNHRVGDLVLHPYGFLHWPGRLRPPYDTFPFPAGTRRTGLTLVVCACVDSPPESPTRRVTEGRAADAKSYREPAPPLTLIETSREPAGIVATVRDVTVELLVAPGSIAPARGGYLLILEAEGPLHAPTDLLQLSPGQTLSGSGIARALLVSSQTTNVDAVPPAWTDLPDLPFAPFEKAPRGKLPQELGELLIEEASARDVEIRIGAHRATVPRYWLSRMLFRIAVHSYRLGYVETYGGFYWDDKNGVARLGLRGGGSIVLEDPANEIERLYRAVAPDGYVELLT